MTREDAPFLLLVALAALMGLASLALSGCAAQRIEPIAAECFQYDADQAGCAMAQMEAWWQTKPVVAAPTTQPGEVVLRWPADMQVRIRGLNQIIQRHAEWAKLMRPTPGLRPDELPQPCPLEYP